VEVYQGFYLAKAWARLTVLFTKGVHGDTESRDPPTVKRLLLTPVLVLILLLTSTPQALAWGNRDACRLRHPELHHTNRYKTFAWTNMDVHIRACRRYNNPGHRLVWSRIVAITFPCRAPGCGWQESLEVRRKPFIDHIWRYTSGASGRDVRVVNGVRYRFSVKQCVWGGGGGCQTFDFWVKVMHLRGTQICHVHAACDEWKRWRG
jgi:hypothetical protein